VRYLADLTDILVVTQTVANLTFWIVNKNPQRSWRITQNNVHHH